MKKQTLTLPVVVIVALLAWLQLDDRAPALDTPGGSEVAQAFADRASDRQVSGQGLVKKLLRDDNEGSRHQRFILALPSGQTLLVAHNVDLAPRIPGLQVGDVVAFSGDYEWNPQGGVLHWTHHDPQGRHPGGWLQHEGKTYQ